MKKLILIKGYLATGKTTYMKKLSKTFNVPAFDKDTIKETISDEIGFKDRAENKKLSLASVKLMYLILERFMMTNCDLILEANFHEEEFLILMDLTNKLNYDVLVLDLWASADISYERFNERAKTNRHKTHLTQDFSEFEGFKKYLLKDNFDITFPRVIKIDANHFTYQDDPELLNKIALFLEKNPC